MEGYARPELLAEPDWLWDHRDDPDVRLIDCDSFEAYQRAHIPDEDIPKNLLALNLERSTRNHSIVEISQ